MKILLITGLLAVTCFIAAGVVVWGLGAWCSFDPWWFIHDRDTRGLFAYLVVAIFGFGGIPLTLIGHARLKKG